MIGTRLAGWLPQGDILPDIFNNEGKPLKITKKASGIHARLIFEGFSSTFGLP